MQVRVTKFGLKLGLMILKACAKFQSNNLSSYRDMMVLKTQDFNRLQVSEIALLIVPVDELKRLIDNILYFFIFSQLLSKVKDGYLKFFNTLVCMVKGEDKHQKNFQ